MVSQITQPTITKYLDTILPPRDSILREMESFAHSHDVPIIGPVVGRILYQLVYLKKAKRVFEMGSAIGYSTLWIARALAEGSVVYYTDSNPANARRAARTFTRAGVSRKVTILTGDAIELFKRTPGKFDVIFLDIDKDQYPDAFHLVLPRLRKGGLLLADNVLWRGLVTRPHKKQDAFTRGITEFNRLIYSSPELFSTILPVRDGFAVCQKV